MSGVVPGPNHRLRLLKGTSIATLFFCHTQLKHKAKTQSIDWCSTPSIPDDRHSHHSAAVHSSSSMQLAHVQDNVQLPLHTDVVFAVGFTVETVVKAGSSRFTIYVQGFSSKVCQADACSALFTSAAVIPIAIPFCLHSCCCCCFCAVLGTSVCEQVHMIYLHSSHQIDRVDACLTMDICRSTAAEAFYSYCRKCCCQTVVIIDHCCVCSTTSNKQMST